MWPWPGCLNRRSADYGRAVSTGAAPARAGPHWAAPVVELLPYLPLLVSTAQPRAAQRSRKNSLAPLGPLPDLQVRVPLLWAARQRSVSVYLVQVCAGWPLAGTSPATAKRAHSRLSSGRYLRQRQRPLNSVPGVPYPWLCPMQLVSGAQVRWRKVSAQYACIPLHLAPSHLRPLPGERHLVPSAI